MQRHADDVSVQQDNKVKMDSSTHGNTLRPGVLMCYLDQPWKGLIMSNI